MLLHIYASLQERTSQIWNLWVLDLYIFIIVYSIAMVWQAIWNLKMLCNRLSPPNKKIYTWMYYTLLGWLGPSLRILVDLETYYQVTTTERLVARVHYQKAADEFQAPSISDFGKVGIPNRHLFSPVVIIDL